MEVIKLEKGYLTILTGKTDMGKSTITVYECGENLRAGKRVVFFSWEYCQSIIYNKLISHFKLGWSQLLNLNIVDAANLDLEALLKIMREKKGTVDILFVDYLDLLRQVSFPTAQTEEENLQQIQEICRVLAALAKELDIPVVLLSQIGASSNFEKAVERLNAFTAKVDTHNTIKMFIGKGNIIDSRIDYTDIVHVILVDEYNLKHYSSINIKEIYGDK
jgi:replicative DNA helicase